MGKRLLASIRFVGWFGGMTFMGVAVALALGRVENDRARLSPALDLAARAILAETDSAVALGPELVLWPAKDRDLWVLSGTATVRTRSGTTGRRSFHADIRNLCDDYGAPRCWRLDSLKRGAATRPPATVAPSVQLQGGARVLGIQRRLATLGFGPGPLDGAMGPRTRKAIRAYQERFGLKVSGRPSAKLLDHLEVNARFARGLAAFKDGDFHAAARHYDRLIGLRPADGDGYFNRGLVYRRLALPELAVADYNAALAREKGHVRALFDRGNTHAELGRYGAATADYADSLSAWIFDGATPFGRLGQELGDLGDAVGRLVR